MELLIGMLFKLMKPTMMGILRKPTSLAKIVIGTTDAITSIPESEDRFHVTTIAIVCFMKQLRRNFEANDIRHKF